MSTFDGYIKEFPDITVDHFTQKQNRPTPRAAFLSHIHKDHLCGLEAYGSSFVYCSAATKELVLRLQTRRDRLLYADKTIERKIRTYENLGYKKDLLRPLPLNTPNLVEVGDAMMSVTLLDANHCPGAVMFLFQRDGISVLYTGDIRAESHWVESLSRSPVLAPYVSEVRTLDCLYLDTTFASKSPLTRDFPERAPALQDLIRTMKAYPDSTIFHFNAWTYGYEDLWVAIASAFDFKIHVDSYRYELFNSIRNPDVWQWGPYLSGHVYKCKKKETADLIYKGVLTSDPNTRFHSCDSRGKCPVRDYSNVVQIIPVTSLSTVLKSDVSGWKRKVEDDPLTMRMAKRRKELILKEPGHQYLVPNENWWVKQDLKVRPPLYSADGQVLPYYIYVPLSRHSSLNELRDMVRLFSPKDIFPCVEDPAKLTYLDLEGCFGDVVDLKECRYLKEVVGKLSLEGGQMKLEDVVKEHWAYDDISEDEEEESQDGSQDHSERMSQLLSVNGQHQVTREIDQRMSAEVEELPDANWGGDETTDETEEEEVYEIEETVVVTKEIRIDVQVDDDTVLVEDGDTSSEDMIRYYMDLVRKGEPIRLESVGGIAMEHLL